MSATLFASPVAVARRITALMRADDALVAVTSRMVPT